MQSKCKWDWVQALKWQGSKQKLYSKKKQFLQACADPLSFTIQTAAAAGMEAAMTDTLCTLDYIGISCKQLFNLDHNFSTTFRFYKVRLLDVLDAKGFLNKIPLNTIFARCSCFARFIVLLRKLQLKTHKPVVNFINFKCAHFSYEFFTKAKM